MYKFGIVEGDAQRPFKYPNIWATEITTGPERLIIAPGEGHVDLLLDLAFCWHGEYYLLYVLLVSRLGNDAGRYQTPSPLDFATVRSFCKRYEDYLQTDGRHHFWIGSAENEGTLVYDQHNVIYAYGDLCTYRDIVTGRGLREADVRFPAPHTHNYNQDNDAEEATILSHWNWRYSPLQKGDEY